jgi:hypothetical protein
VVEQGTHKPLVGSSNLPPGMFCVCLGSTFFAALLVATTSVQQSISMHGLDSICAATLRLQNDSEIRLKLLQGKKCRLSVKLAKLSVY